MNLGTHSGGNGRERSGISKLVIAALVLACVTASVWFAARVTTQSKPVADTATNDNGSARAPAGSRAAQAADTEELVAESGFEPDRPIERAPVAKSHERKSADLPEPSPNHASCEFIALDTATRAPIEGARFDVRPAPARAKTVGPARELTTVRSLGAAAGTTVSAAGYATESAEVEWHANEFVRHAIELGRCATLRVTCRGTLPAGAKLSIERFPRVVPIAQPLRYLPRQLDIAAVAPGLARVDLACLPANCKLAVAVKAVDGTLLSAVENVELDPARATEVELQVFTVVAVRGRLLRDDGMWIRNCGMIAVATTLDLRQVLTGVSKPAAHATTDGFGHFEFQSLPAGLWLIGPDPRNFTASGGRSGKPVPLAEVLNTLVLPPPELLEVRLPAGLSISGIARDAHGNALTRASFLYRAAVDSAQLSDNEEGLRWLSEQTRTDGTFELDRLLPGEYDLRLADEPTSIVRVRAGSTGVVLCNAQRGVSGRVLLPAGASAMQARVAVLRPVTDPGRAWVVETHRVAADGTYSIPTAARGDLIVVATEPGLALFGWARATSIEHDFFTRVDVELHAACRIELQRARADSRVAFGLADGWVLPQIAVLSPAREWVLLPAGDFTVWREIVDERGASTWAAAQTLTARAGATLEVDTP